MNYMIIQRTGDDPKVPPKIIQMFTDRQLHQLKRFVLDAIDNMEVLNVAFTFIHLIEQWEKCNED